MTINNNYYDVCLLIDFLITLGENGKSIAQGALDAGFRKENVITFESTSQISSYLKDFLLDGDVILVKGSRGMKMEEIADKLVNHGK